MASSIRWEGVNQVMARMDEYERKVLWAVSQVALYFQAVFESYAKENAPWTDRTGNARQSLHAWTEELAGNIVRLWLSHGVDYGKYLETANQGKYAIIWETIQAHLQAIRDMLQGIFAR